MTLWISNKSILGRARGRACVRAAIESIFRHDELCVNVAASEESLSGHISYCAGNESDVKRLLMSEKSILHVSCRVELMANHKARNKGNNSYVILCKF